MSDTKRERTEVKAAVSLGPIWLMGWLFTLGMVHPTFWKALLALLIWPYYLGRALGG